MKIEEKGLSRVEGVCAWVNVLCGAREVRGI